MLFISAIYVDREGNIGCPSLVITADRSLCDEKGNPKVDHDEIISKTTCNFSVYFLINACLIPVSIIGLKWIGRSWR